MSIGKFVRKALEMSSAEKKCAICGTSIRPNFKVCKKDWEFYEQHKHETWMKFLIKESNETYKLDKLQEALEIGDFTKDPKTYNKLDKSQVDLIRFYREKGLGAVSISKILGINSNIIKYYIKKFDKL